MNIDHQNAFARCGWCWLKDYISADAIVRLDNLSGELLLSADAQLLKYYELTPNGRVCSRVERFVGMLNTFDFLIGGGSPIAELVAALFGDRPVLFKEKINYKPSNGGHYSVHQDAPAYRGFGVTDFITVMIPIDDSTEDNGCLEIATGPRIGRELSIDGSGLICDPELASIEFCYAPAKARDILVFDGLVPHRSGKNNTTKSRRAVFMTFNRQCEGDQRQAYYEAKRASFPPEEERSMDRDYHKTGVQFNLGNPFL